MSLISPELIATSRRMAAADNASVDRILHAVRVHLGTEIAFVSRYREGGMKELTHVDSDLDLPMGPGYVDSREDSYCWHIAQGRLPELIQDPADHPFTRTMAITDFLPVGCHLNTPLRLSDGTIYGSFCCLSRAPDRTMTERDLGVLKAFAALAVEQIERTLETDTRTALSAGTIGALIDSQKLAIAHQPIVDLASGDPVGFEALARFTETLPQRAPDLWFAEAAAVGLGTELELLAITRALATLPLVPADSYLSLNASPDTVMSGALTAILAGVPRGRVVLELTEHQEVADFAALKARLGELSAHVRIAIDDVGAGYAGLRHLVDLGPHLLKLDTGLTRNVDSDPARRALVAAMVRFAGDIGCRLIAEGIETPEERAALVDLGIDYGQGYLLGRPRLVA